MVKLVIKGAYYKSGDTILVPHYTGEFHTVDCTKYETKEEIEAFYDETFIKENKHDYVKVDDVKYYYAEYSPFLIVDDWDLLSDLSELEHIENEQSF